MNALYWREPAWALLALAPLLWLAFGRWRARRLDRRYADPALWPWALGSTPVPGAGWRRGALLIAWLLIGLAAAGPRLPHSRPPNQGEARATLVVVLDLSRSMAAADVWPSRRGLARRALVDLLPDLSASRVGLVVVAGAAHRLWPATADRTVLAQLVADLDRLRMPSHGSAVAAGIELALADLAAQSGPRRLLVLSDGDLAPTEWPALAAALAEATRRQVELVFAGVGTPGGAALPGADGDWLRRDGEPVLSRVDEAGLAALSEAAGARYLTLPDEHPAAALRAALPTDLMRLALDADAPVVWRELFPWLLAPALLLWLVALLRLPPLAAPAGLATSLLYLAGLVLALPAHADPLRDAHLALANDPARARALFDTLPGYAARMGSGSACHRQQDWACARRAFAQAVLLAPDDRSRAAALYNLAHSVFQEGDYAGAAGLFGDALAYRPDYPAARHNRDFAAALAAEVARLAGGEQDADRRTGRGPAQRSSNGEPPPATPLTLAPDETPRAPELSSAQRQALVNRGLAHTRLADKRRGDANAPWGQTYGIGAGVSVADISLWRTLLERAEGLPVSPAEPLLRPGVRPW